MGGAPSVSSTVDSTRRVYKTLLDGRPVMETVVWVSTPYFCTKVSWWRLSQ